MQLGHCEGSNWVFGETITYNFSLIGYTLIVWHWGGKEASDKQIVSSAPMIYDIMWAQSIYFNFMVIFWGNKIFLAVIWLLKLTIGLEIGMMSVKQMLNVLDYW